MTVSESIAGSYKAGLFNVDVFNVYWTKKLNKN